MQKINFREYLAVATALGYCCLFPSVGADVLTRAPRE
jgi:hypothetical protein